MQLCVTKPVLLESECSMRQGHMGFLPTSSLPSSPSLEYTLSLPAREHKSTGKKTIYVAEWSHRIGGILGAHMTPNAVLLQQNGGYNASRGPELFGFAPTVCDRTINNNRFATISLLSYKTLHCLVPLPNWVNTAGSIKNHLAP